MTDDILYETPDDATYPETKFEPIEPTSCPCECHKPTHEARKPSPLTMIGRGNG